MALHALSRCTARILLEEQHDPAVFKSDWEFVRSLAQLGMEERAKGGWCVLTFGISVLIQRTEESLIH